MPHVHSCGFVPQDLNHTSGWLFCRTINIWCSTTNPGDFPNITWGCWWEIMKRLFWCLGDRWTTVHEGCNVVQWVWGPGSPLYPLHNIASPMYHGEKVAESSTASKHTHPQKAESLTSFSNHFDISCLGNKRSTHGPFLSTLVHMSEWLDILALMTTVVSPASLNIAAWASDY